jgi:hypothetical protein
MKELKDLFTWEDEFVAEDGFHVIFPAILKKQLGEYPPGTIFYEAAYDSKSGVLELQGVSENYEVITIAIFNLNEEEIC